MDQRRLAKIGGLDKGLELPIAKWENNRIMPVTLQELEVDIMANPFAVIYGNDHYSFPSALVNARELGIPTVLHFDEGPGGQAYSRMTFVCATSNSSGSPAPSASLESFPGSLRFHSRNWVRSSSGGSGLSLSRSSVSEGVRIGSAAFGR